MKFARESVQPAFIISELRFVVYNHVLIIFVGRMIFNIFPAAFLMVKLLLSPGSQRGWSQSLERG